MILCCSYISRDLSLIFLKTEMSSMLASTLLMRLKCNNSIEPAVIVRFMCFNEKKRHPNDETLYNITCLFISQGLSRIVYDSCFFERTDVATGFELFNRLQLMHVLNSICLDFNWKMHSAPKWKWIQKLCSNHLLKIMIFLFLFCHLFAYRCFVFSIRLRYLATELQLNNYYCD